jgi:hypothetical protein
MGHPAIGLVNETIWDHTISKRPASDSTWVDGLTAPMKSLIATS